MSEEDRFTSLFRNLAIAAYLNPRNVRKMAKAYRRQSTGKVRKIFSEIEAQERPDLVVIRALPLIEAEYKRARQ